MSSRINTILLVGATTGIGEALVRRFHGMGKKVIATGRTKAKLDALAAELPGLDTRQFDMTDISSLPSIVEGILRDYPDLDTVFINGGIQKCYNIFDPSTAGPEQIIREITTNLTAPNILAQLFAPHLLALAKNKNKKTNIFLTTSALGYVPLGFYPTYCATKAGLSAFIKTFRQQLSSQGGAGSENLSIVEVVPPYVDTGLDSEHRAYTVAMQGGEDKASPPIALEEYIEGFFTSLEDVNPVDGSLKKEIGVGFGGVVAEMWRGTFEKVYTQFGMTV